ncbi:hypothetical protein LTS10_011995 [Elasticomyces elasticus]|nr:hypothetical protein LTS10_011995 [Elasticomyces elasticus]
MHYREGEQHQGQKWRRYFCNERQGASNYCPLPSSRQYLLDIHLFKEYKQRTLHGQIQELFTRRGLIGVRDIICDIPELYPGLTEALEPEVLDGYYSKIDDDGEDWLDTPIPQDWFEVLQGYVEGMSKLEDAADVAKRKIEQVTNEARREVRAAQEELEEAAKLGKEERPHAKTAASKIFEEATKAATKKVEIERVAIVTVRTLRDAWRAACSELGAY